MTFTIRCGNDQGRAVTEEPTFSGAIAYADAWLDRLMLHGATYVEVLHADERVYFRRPEWPSLPWEPAVTTVRRSSDS